MRIQQLNDRDIGPRNDPQPWVRLLCAASLALLASSCARDASRAAEQANDTLQTPANGIDSARIPTAGSEDTGNAVPAADSASTPAPVHDAGWTSGTTDARKPGAGIGVLQHVRIATQRDYERIVFDFGTDTLPGYHIEYVDRPVYACGSGDVVRLAGDAWLEVRFQPAQAHDDEGRPTLTDRGRMLGQKVLLEMRLTCDYEADVTFVFGLSRPNRYRVLELASPTRLVVDILAR